MWENPHRLLAITSIRFQEEIDHFQKLGFQHFHVTCSPETWSKRQGANLSKETQSNRTESLAKLLDQTATGPHVIWNDPYCPPPKEKTTKQYRSS